MPRKRWDLTFPPRSATKPIMYHLVKDFDLEPNILRARIDPGQKGHMLVEVTGGKEGIAQGVTYMESVGVIVREAASDIALDEDLCVTCGVCTSVCRPEALVLAHDTADLRFDKDKCVYCEACVIACPRRAISLEL